jgi:hypothetical protein
MGSVLYDFLSESLLFNDELLEGRYESLSQRCLAHELAKYRDFCDDNSEQIAAEAKDNKSPLKVYWNAHPSVGLDIAQLKQSAFYLDQWIIPDPLYPLTSRASDSPLVDTSPWKLPFCDAMSGMLYTAVKAMKLLIPMVEHDYVKFLPYDSCPSVHTEELNWPMTEEFERHVRQHALVEGPTGTLRKLNNKSLAPNDLGILFEIEPKIYLDCASMSDAGVAQPARANNDNQQLLAGDSKNLARKTLAEAATRVMTFLQRQFRKSYEFDASFLARSQSVYDLLGLIFPGANDIQRYTSYQLVRLRLPFLRGVDISDLLRIRKNEESFMIFRGALEKIFAELRLENNDETIRLKAENAMHEFSEVQLPQVNSKIKQLRVKAFAEAGLGLAGFAGSVATGGVSLLATGVALAQLMKTCAEYKKEMVVNPAYFLWRVSRTKARRGVDESLEGIVPAIQLTRGSGCPSCERERAASSKKND